MSGQAPRNRYQSVLIACSRCKARGALTTEPARGEKPVAFVSIAGEFHVETGRTLPDSTVVVCDQCDEIYEILPAVKAAH